MQRIDRYGSYPHISSSDPLEAVIDIGKLESVLMANGDIVKSHCWLSFEAGRQTEAGITKV